MLITNIGKILVKKAIPIDQAVTLDIDGVATVTGQGTIILSSYSGVTDTLTKIAGLINSEVVYLKAATGHTITIASNANLETPTSSYSLSGNKRITMISQGSDVCEQLSQSSNS